MKIILLQDVKKVGQKGSIVEVADGYAQNVLIPKKLALPATGANLKQAEKRESQTAEKKAMDESLAQKALADIDGKTVVIKARANDSGGLFESVREKQVAEAIQTFLNVPIPESVIDIGDPIKKLGSYEVRVRTHGASATVYLQVVA